MYSQIRNRAPNARIVVLGYPHLYKIGGSCAYGIGDTSRNAINSAADTIDSVISARRSLGRAADGALVNAGPPRTTRGSHCRKTPP
ncbi:hypothetical protein [Streptomyces sp. NPDC001601]|uniref:hypothetical protein n=1 Tax=Streptomyces sp. NPDC001601 TaxID=3364592 RepID=UPI003679231A